MIDQPASSRRDAFLAVGLILVAFLVTVLMRLGMFHERTGAQGLEASYHILWTAAALENSPPEAHRFLPTVTLAPEPGNPIRWGATVATPGGAFIYTSFPPLGFLLPAIPLRSVDSELRFFALALLNSLVGLVAALMMGGLARATVLLAGPPQPDSKSAERTRDGWIIFALCGLVYLFSREALIGHGAVFWSHSLAQIPLIAGCYLALKLFAGLAGAGTILGLALVAFLYPSLEWTGFVFGAGLVAVFLYAALFRNGGPQALKAAFAVAAGTTLAGLVMVAHFALAIGAGPLLSALSRRAQARDFAGSLLLDLPLGWLISFGLLLPAALVALAWLVTRPASDRPREAFWLLLVAASFPLLENIVMMQHAVQFSFDRLKLGVPLLLLSAMALWVSRLPARRPGLLAGMTAAILLSNLALFVRDLNIYGAWAQIAAANSRLIAQLKADPVATCAAIGTDIKVRGYLNLAFMRDMHEYSTPKEVLADVDRIHGCGAVFVSARSSAFPDLPELLGIDVYGPDGRLLRRYGD